MANADPCRLPITHWYSKPNVHGIQGIPTSCTSAEAGSSTSNSILGPFGMSGWARWIATYLRKAITITFGVGWEPTDVSKEASMV